MSRVEKQLARQSVRRARQREVEQKRNMEESKNQMISNTADSPCNVCVCARACMCMHACMCVWCGVESVCVCVCVRARIVWRVCVCVRERDREIVLNGKS